MNAIENMTPVMQEDKEYVPKWQTIGTPTTAEEALIKYEDMIYRLIKQYPNNPVCNAEDMVQEGRCAIVDAFYTYNPDYQAQLGTWTYRRIKDALSNFFKKNSRCLAGGSSLYQKIKDQESCDDEISQRLKESFVTQNLDDLANMIGDDDVKMQGAGQFEGFDWRKYLTEDEITVIEYKFGFYGGKPMRAKDIGEIMGGRSAKSVEYLWHQALPKLQRIPGIEDFFFA